MNYHRVFQILLITVLAMSMATASLAQIHLIIGGEDEENDGMILRPRQIEEGPDGNLYVLDAGDSFIKVYSSLGQYLHKLAGPGEGPGEFQRTDGSSFGFTTDGNLFFTEFFGGHRWLSIMELNGDLVQTLSPQVNVSYGVLGAVSLDDGGFLVHIAYSSEAFPSHSYYLYNMRHSLVHMDSLGAIVTEIVQTKRPSMISYTPNGGTTNLPYVPTFTWTPWQNDTVVWSEGLNPQLSVFDYNGIIVGKIDTKLSLPEKVTSDDLKNWRRSRKELMESNNSAWWNQFGKVIEDYDKSLFDKPILRNISAAPEDHLLVAGPWNSETSQTTYWLFDSQGAMISTFTANVWGLHISAHNLLYFLADEDESTSVHAVKWSGPVGESLNFFQTTFE